MIFTVVGLNDWFHIDNNMAVRLEDEFGVEVDISGEVPIIPNEFNIEVHEDIQELKYALEKLTDIARVYATVDLYKNIIRVS